MHLPDSATRIERATSDSLNQRIHREMEDRLRFYSRHPELIGQRLAELDREWDIERVLAANAATLSLTGSILAATVDRRWLILPAVVTSFLLQHALQGWCPPLPVFRRMGFRAAREIEMERHALKAMRGDYAAQSATRRPEEVMAAASQ